MTTQNPSQPNPNIQFDILSTLVNDDVTILKIKDKSYGSSWRKRGGIGAYMMAARKWDRLEEMMTIRSDSGELIGYKDMFIVIRDEYARGVYDNGAEPDNSFLAQLRDLRRYLGLIDSWTFMNSPPTTPIPDDDIRSLKPGQIAPYDPLTGKIGPKRPAAPVDNSIYAGKDTPEGYPAINELAKPTVVSDGEGADNPYTARRGPADAYQAAKQSASLTKPPLGTADCD